MYVRLQLNICRDWAACACVVFARYTLSAFHDEKGFSAQTFDLHEYVMNGVGSSSHQVITSIGGVYERASFRFWVAWSGHVPKKYRYKNNQDASAATRHLRSLLDDSQIAECLTPRIDPKNLLIYPEPHQEPHNSLRSCLIHLSWSSLPVRA